MKKLLVSLFIATFVFVLNAQEKGKIRVGLDAGLGIPKLGVGFDCDLDIRYNIMDNLNVGVKFGVAALAKDIIIANPENSTFTSCGLTSSLITSDYYFNKQDKSFAPFLGGGFGSYFIANLRATNSIPSSSIPWGISVENKFGGLLRGGFEVSHFRMALEYYLIPQSSLVDLSNSIIGTTSNSYLNLTIGFYLGGGKWKK
jgi:outer membrane protein W